VCLCVCTLGFLGGGWIGNYQLFHLFLFTSFFSFRLLGGADGMGISGQERMVDREKQRRAGIHSQTSFFFRFVLRIFVEGTVDRMKHERAGIISQTYATEFSYRNSVIVPNGVRCIYSTMVKHRAFRIQLSFRTVFVAFIARWLSTALSQFQ
jgi:hypothetical protein